MGTFVGGYWAQHMLWVRSGTSGGGATVRVGMSIRGWEGGQGEASLPPGLPPSVLLFLVWAPLHFLHPPLFLALSLSSPRCLWVSPRVVGPAQASPLPSHASPQAPPSLSPVFLPAICLPVYCTAGSSEGQGEAGAEAGSPREVRGLQLSGGRLLQVRRGWGEGGRCQDCCP